MAKSFKTSMEQQTQSNAALAYITQPQDEADRERKSKRVNLLIKPSQYDALSKIATMKRTSVNDLICQMAERYIEEHAETIEQFKSIFDKE